MRHKLAMYLMELLGPHIEVLIDIEVEERVKSVMEQHITEYHSAPTTPIVTVNNSDAEIGAYIKSFMKEKTD